MSARHFIVATAGHVDHGKSALVKALTGTDPDRLPEEKARGITIDLGFAHLELPSTLNSEPSTFHLGIVDVPGHEDFVKNMVAGVGSIDLALFVVAADDGWMPQTEEHLQILAYLGVSRAVVALTKIDLVQHDEEAAVANLRRHLLNTPFAKAPIVRTSVVTDRGLDELKLAFDQVLAGLPAPRDIGKPRLPVDRVFTLRGIGTVVTGTLTGGVLRRGQTVAIQPSGKTTRIRSLQNHNCDVESAGSGMRAALNLPDLPVASGGQDGIHRGDVVTLAELGGSSDTLDVVLEKSARLLDSKSPAARPLKDGAIVHIHHGSASSPARVVLPQGAPLLPGGRVQAELRFEAPVHVFLGDRFIIRDWAEQCTLAGGIVLEAEASRKNFRSEAQQKFLSARTQSPESVVVAVDTQLERDGAVRHASLLLKSRFSQAEIDEAVARLASSGRAIRAGEWLADGIWWQKLRQRAAAAIDAEHEAHPDHPGLPLNQLRSTLAGEFRWPAVFELLVADLCRSEFVQTGAAIRRAAHQPALPAHLQKACEKLRAALSIKPLEPPSRKELAPDGPMQQALRFLIQTGQVVELGPEVVLLVESFHSATGLIRAFLHDHGSATVSELRQALGASRRIVVPLLERLDRDGVTVRLEDKRSLRPRPTAGPA